MGLFFFCRGEAISITYSECASVALVIHPTKRMRRNVMSFVAGPVVQHFYILSHQR